LFIFSFKEGKLKKLNYESSFFDIGKFPMEIADLINFDIDAINLDETAISSLKIILIYISLKLGGG